MQRLPSFLCLCVALWVLLGCRERNAAPESLGDTQDLPEIAAETLRLEMQSWPTVVRCQGNLLPDEQVVVGAKVGGRVDAVHIEIGDFVEQGAPLATLDQQEARLRVLQAQAQLRQARSAVGLLEGQSADDLNPENAAPVREAKAVWDEGIAGFKRAQMLIERNALSAAEFDQAAAAEQVAQAQYASSLNAVAESLALIGVRQAELSIAQQQLADAVVTAPFSGYVQQRGIAPGAYVATGQPIAVLVRTSPLRFRGAVPERFAQSLKLGQEVRLTIQSVPTPVTAAVTRISPMLDSRSRTLMFEAEVANKDHQLRTGLFAEAEIVIDPAARAIVLPESAIVEFAGTQKVWKVVDGMASEQPIATSHRRPGYREVAEGLEIGDLVLIDGDQGAVAKVTGPTVRSSLATSRDEPGDVKDTKDAVLNNGKPTESPASMESTEDLIDEDSNVRASS
tara:strand:- start:69 stop:1424 length:1356 start_codon:yes stop_codon:yes gene_type:complete